jgi:hypothetical protein
MSNDGRVLSHIRARQLSEEEFNHVGGAYLTNKTGDCTFDAKTCVMDGDCEPPLGC